MAMDALTITISAGFASRSMIAALALTLDAVIGDPPLLWRRMPHPVVMFGALIRATERYGNAHIFLGRQRRFFGFIAIAFLLILAWGVGAGAEALLLLGAMTPTPIFIIAAIECVFVAILLAGGDLNKHVRAVSHALETQDLTAARREVSKIVGRDPNSLDEAGVCRAAIETTAENLSDGVIAPLFYYLIGGLPGICIYKMINTADSMIGYKSSRYYAFGFAAARLDDVANFIPARLCGFLIALCGIAVRPLRIKHSFVVMWRDAQLHRSPNAGWAEAAMAGLLDVSLAGSRRYGNRITRSKALNAPGRTATTHDVYLGLRSMWSVIAAMVIVLLLAGFVAQS